MTAATLIPHRPPMHWIDSAVMADDGSVTATRTLAKEHPFVRDVALLPTALIEMMAQAAACGAAMAAKARGMTLRRGLLVAIRDFVVDVETPVATGATITLTSVPETSFGSLSACRCTALLQGVTVATARLTFRVEVGPSLA